MTEERHPHPFEETNYIYLYTKRTQLPTVSSYGYLWRNQMKTLELRWSQPIQTKSLFSFCRDVIHEFACEYSKVIEGKHKK